MARSQLRICDAGYGLESAETDHQNALNDAAAAVLSAGYCSVGTLKHALFQKVYTSVGRPDDARSGKAAMQSIGFVDLRVEPGVWTNCIADLVDKAVRQGRLALYGWPAWYDARGRYVIQPPPQQPVTISTDVLTSVGTLHRGVPSTVLRLRPSAARRLAALGQVLPMLNAFVVVEVRAAAAWIESERLKGCWPTQRSRNLRPIKYGRGRPFARPELLSYIEKVVSEGAWDGTRSLPRLCRLLDELAPEAAPHKRDTVRRGVERLYQRTGDGRYQRRFGRPHEAPGGSIKGFELTECSSIVPIGPYVKVGQEEDD
jgi:hypothetical protein